jgi:heptosyltransferase-1
MKLLLVKLSSFGDVVHTFPAVTDLRKARPDVEIDWAVEEAFAPVAALHPAVSKVIPVAYRRLRWPPGRWSALATSLVELRRSLHDTGYDLVLDAQGLIKSAAVARLAGAPVAGLDRASAREPAASRAYARRFAVERNLHAVERTRRLFAAALGYASAGEGAYGLPPPSAPPVPGLPPRYVLLLHSASWPSKLWAEDRWRRLAAWLAANGRSVVLPWGTEAEKARAARIAAGLSAATVLPEVLSGAGLAALIAGAELSIGLDSGLMHLSAALGVPGIWLYGPTDPGLTGPYGPGQIVVQSKDPAAPCRTRDCAHGSRCMDGVDFDRVAVAASRRLSQSRPAGATTS